MKILRIQLLNLNSLPEGDLNLEDGPLADAGIFAITGPTGSGKSTVLDAVTLALYGRAARYGSLPNPPDIMSRHTGECRAEVLFEVPRGRFVARWEMRRARKKSTGALQQAQRTICDANGVVLAQKINEADRLIEELTGLDYGRFVRSVLLAQGEFAQFLKAGKDDRAALLESLTGTHIYSDLGVLAFQECTTRENALAQAEAALGRIALLGYEERLGACSGIGRLSGEIETLTDKRDALARRIQLGRQLSDLFATAAELTRKQDALGAEKVALAPEIERLARHRLAQPFFADLQALDTLAGRVTLEKTGYDSAITAAAKARAALASGLHAASSLAAELVSAAETATAEARNSAAELQRSRAAVDDWLALHAADKTLESELAGIVERLSALAGAREKLAAATAERKAVAAERQSATERATSLQAVLHASMAKESAAADASKSATGARDALLAGASLESLQTGLDLLEQRRTLLLDFQGVFKLRDAADLRLQTLAGETAACTQRREQARADEERCRAEARACEERLELTRENVALLKRIAKLEEQRDLLKPGEPCPLCGSHEHPFAAGDAQPSAGLRDAEKALAAATVAAKAATGAAQKASEARARAEQALTGHQARIAEAQTEFDACSKLHAAHSITLGLTDAEALSGALSENTSAREARTTLIRSIRSAEQASAKAEVEHVRAQGETRAVREKIAAQCTILSGFDERLVRADTLLAATGLQIEALGAELGAPLGVFGISLPAAGAERSTAKSLEKRRQKWQQQTACRQRFETEIQQAAASAADLDCRTVALRAQALRLGESAPAADLAGAAAEPGEATRMRRQWRTLDDAATALARYQTAVAATAAATDERRSVLLGTEDALRRDTDAFNAHLAASGVPFADIATLRAARLDDAAVQRIAPLQAGLEQRIADTTTRLDQIHDQCRQLREAATGEPVPDAADLPALEAERRRLDELAVAATEQRTTLRNDLARDDDNRRVRQEQVAALADERRRLGIWERLRHLIGSADGAKFRQFAQGLSLDVVLRHANRHLSRLNDRYRLQRAPGADLMLEIVDRHQAGAIRPMLSLSGGETFLVSLALALGLSDLAGRNARIDSLFIDEGFGSLDADALDTAVAALDTLRLSNKTIGVISHVELLKERIPVQIRVERLAGGISVLRPPGV